MLKIDDPQPQQSAASTGFALWNLGFRPFYLLASSFAALSILLWVCQYTGHLPAVYVRSPAWHGHEMLYGYTLAVVAGFLLTAVRTWTGKPTPAGVPLMALAALWVAGRVLVLTPFATAAAVVNAAFPVAVAIGIGIPIVQSRNRRNYFFIALLLLLGLAVLAFHLAHLGMLPVAGAREPAGWTRCRPVHHGRDGRAGDSDVHQQRRTGCEGNAAPGGRKARAGWRARRCLRPTCCRPLRESLPWSRCSLPRPTPHGSTSGSRGGRSARRSCGSCTWPTAGLSSILCCADLSAFGFVGELLAVHALTVGAIGGMTIGMMTRTARGHTGRPLVADHFEVACYVLVVLAAALRVFGGMLLPDAYMATVVASGICWSAAFALYAVRYWPVLSRPRLDGKPG